METFQTPFGSFACFKNDQNFYFHLSRGGYWEYELITGLLAPYFLQARTILDIGAHIGSHSFLYGYFNPAAKIYAFEPQSEIYKLLVMNMSSRPNVRPMNKCVGHKLGTAQMSQHAHFGENSEKTLQYGDAPTMNLGGVSLGVGGEPVEMITIDSLNLPECDFIKMDVEGAEGLVVQGARQTIQKYRPAICYEYSPQLDTSEMKAFFGLEAMPDVRKELEALGYTTFKQLEGDNWIALP